MVFGCSQNISGKSSTNTNDIEITADKISKKYYTKNVSDSFSAFLKNPDALLCRSASGDNISSEELLFSKIWSDLTEDERELLQNNIESIQVSEDSSLSIKKDTPIGRAVLYGGTSEIDSIASFYHFTEWVKDKIGNTIVNITFDDTDLEEHQVPANLAIEYFAKLEKWDSIESILARINSNISMKDIKLKYNELVLKNAIHDDNHFCRASATVDYQSQPIREDVGRTLSDGTVMLTCFKKKAYPIIGGNWAHAGIFSEDAYIRYGRKDSAYCVYTAQPDGYDNFPDYMKPDKQNHCCLDTICMYSYQKRMATMLPFGYSRTGATEAIKYAKENFYDKSNTYNIPVSEFFWIGDTSHDMTDNNPYCSKVVYSAWRNAGKDLDSNTFGGNLVTPDDLYGSAFDRYLTITISILFWSASWSIKTYSATSYICTEESQ